MEGTSFAKTRVIKNSRVHSHQLYQVLLEQRRNTLPPLRKADKQRLGGLINHHSKIEINIQTKQRKSKGKLLDLNDEPAPAFFFPPAKGHIEFPTSHQYLPPSSHHDTTTSICRLRRGLTARPVGIPDGAGIRITVSRVLPRSQRPVIVHSNIHIHIHIPFPTFQPG